MLGRMNWVWRLSPRKRTAVMVIYYGLGGIGLAAAGWFGMQMLLAYLDR